MIEIVSTAFKVLIVEDEPLTCLALEALLQDANFVASTALSDARAYAALSETAFDALIVDVNLGEGTTGYDVARFARRLNPALPVLYLSGGSPDWVTAFGVKGSEFMAKPFEEQELLATLNRLLGRADEGPPNDVPLSA